MLEQGKLYKVNDFALSDSSIHCSANGRIVTDDGYLWVWEGERDGEAPSDGYLCRSLATGETQTFYPEELETSE